MKKGTAFNKICKPEWLCPGIHFLLSFFYEWTILLLHPEVITVAAVAKNSEISDATERIMSYALSKALAGVFIFLGWRLFFYVLRKWKEEKWIQVFFIAYAIGGVILLLLWPNTFVRSIDNYMTYTYAIRLYPEYWHSAYTSVVYAACIMILPHPFAISMALWTLFVFDLGYVYHRLQKRDCFKKGSQKFAFLLLLIPGIYPLITDPFRTEFYALLCIFYVATILFDAAEKREYSWQRTLCMAFCSAMIGVWRTEGVILGGLGFIAILLFMKKGAIWKRAAWLLAFAALFLLINMPQKLGNQKYYGSDYSIMNSFASLRNILNTKDANLSYDGAAEDLAAIEAVVPVEAVKEYGDDGYRRYNSMNGNADINQSLVDFETGERYVKAYYRIILHNPVLYLRTQLGMLLQALRIRDYGFVVANDETLTNEYPQWTFHVWQYGMEDFDRALFVKKWNSFGARNALVSLWDTLRVRVEQFLIRVKVIPLILLLILLAEVIIFFRELVWILKRKFKATPIHWCIAFLAMTLLGQFAAIVLFMPVGAANYFHAFYFCSGVLGLIEFCYEKDKADGEKADAN